MKLIRRLKKKKSTESQHSTAAPIGGASTSSTANDKLTKTDAIQNAGKLFEVLQSVGDASNLLSPLKALCGILKIATDMAVVGNCLLIRTILRQVYPLQFLYKNGEDLQDLADKLEQQKKSIEQEIGELSSPEFSKLKDIKGLVHPLEQYGSFVRIMHPDKQC